MGVSASLIIELEDAMHSGEPGRRVDTLRRVTDLFLSGAERFSAEQVGLFDDVIGSLINHIEGEALAELGEQLAPVDNAPIKVIRQLARHDEIAVSGPVLSRSERLADADLVEIAETKGQAHLLAISGRRQLAAPITDVLVRRGDTKVARRVAENSGAAFSEHGYVMLVERAGQDGTLAEKISQRSDIPPHLFRTLVTQATKVVQQRLLASVPADRQAKIREVIEKASGKVASAAQAAHDQVTALDRVLLIHQTTQLTERDLLDFARAGRLEESIAALSILCAMPIEAVDGMLRGERSDPILILGRASGYEWPTVRALLMLRTGSQGTSAGGLEAAHEEYKRLSRSTAERALRFWRVRQTTLNQDEAAR